MLPSFYVIVSFCFMFRMASASSGDAAFSSSDYYKDTCYINGASVSGFNFTEGMYFVVEDSNNNAVLFTDKAEVLSENSANPAICTTFSSYWNEGCSAILKKVDETSFPSRKFSISLWSPNAEKLAQFDVTESIQSCLAYCQASRTTRCYCSSTNVSSSSGDNAIALKFTPGFIRTPHHWNVFSRIFLPPYIIISVLIPVGDLMFFSRPLVVHHFVFNVLFQILGGTFISISSFLMAIVWRFLLGKCEVTLAIMAKMTYQLAPFGKQLVPTATQKELDEARARPEAKSIEDSEDPVVSEILKRPGVWSKNGILFLIIFFPVTMIGIGLVSMAVFLQCLLLLILYVSIVLIPFGRKHLHLIENFDRFVSLKMDGSFDLYLVINNERKGQPTDNEVNQSSSYQPPEIPKKTNGTSH